MGIKQMDRKPNTYIQRLPLPYTLDFGDRISLKNGVAVQKRGDKTGNFVLAPLSNKCATQDVVENPQG